MTRDLPGVWLPTLRAGTGADVFTMRLGDALRSRGVPVQIDWLPHRAEWLPGSAARLTPPPWATVAHVNSWLPRRFWPSALPVVVTVHHLVHDPAFAPFRSKWQAAYHETLIRPREFAGVRDAAAVTTVSDYVRATVTAFSGRNDVVTVPNWVDTALYRPRDHSGASGTGAPFRLLIAGSQSYRKGSDLLPALARALGSRFEIRCAGSHRTQPTEQNVVMLGRLTELELVHEFQSCDAVLSLSRYEGFGYTALEGMACGRPVVGFRTSGIAEVATPDVALLARVNDLQGLVAACQHLAGDRSLAQAMGDAARRRALLFSCDAAVGRYLQVYKAAVA